MEMKHDKVVISRKAQTSIKEIFEFVKKETSIEIAKKVKDAIIAKCKSLKNFAGYSKEMYLEELEGDYRSVTQWNYNIIYKVTDKEIRILNVIHTSRHPANRKDIYSVKLALLPNNIGFAVR